MFLGEFGSVAFAVALLYSSFLHQKDYVGCHLANLLMLHCLLSRLGVLSTAACKFHNIDCGCCLRSHKQPCTMAIRHMPPLSRPHRVGPWQGCMLGPIVHPAVRCAFFFCNDTVHIMCPECGVYKCALHASVLWPSEICVALRNRSPTSCGKAAPTWTR